MLEARRTGSSRRGEAPIDVEAEVDAAAGDGRRRGPSGALTEAELRAEVRQLVVARNERRMRRGWSRSTSRPRPSASSPIS